MIKAGLKEKCLVMDMNILSRGPEETREIGRKIGERLMRGDVVALTGILGAGKTCLVQGLVNGLEVKTDYITSPSFVLINEYQGRMPVYHFDVYRLNEEKEVLDLGYEEYIDGAGVTIIEWADKISRLLPRRSIRILLTITGPGKRTLNIRSSRDLVLGAEEAR